MAVPAAIEVAKNSRGVLADAEIAASPTLPVMARCLCLYGILVNPSLFLGRILVSAISGGPDASGSSAASARVGGIWLLIGLCSAVLMWIGGVKLRSWKASGIRLIHTGLFLDLILLPVLLIASLIAQATGSIPTGTPLTLHRGTESFSAQRRREF